MYFSKKYSDEIYFNIISFICNLKTLSEKETIFFNRQPNRFRAQKMFKNFNCARNSILHMQRERHLKYIS